MKVAKWMKQRPNVWNKKESLFDFLLLLLLLTQQSHFQNHRPPPLLLPLYLLERQNIILMVAVITVVFARVPRLLIPALLPTLISAMTGMLIFIVVVIVDVR